MQGKSECIEILAKHRQRGGACRILAFTVMDNHVHLVLQPDTKVGLSVTMKWISGVYTMNYNRVFKTWGHVWGARYFSRPINGFGDLVSTMCYVDQNPVKAFLVNHPWQWRWSGLWHHRCGDRRVVDSLPAGLLLQLPQHEILRV